MSELHDLLDRVAERVPTPAGGYERTRQRAKRRTLLRRLRAGSVAILVVAVPILVVLRMDARTTSRPSTSNPNPWSNFAPGLQSIPPLPQDRIGASVVWTGQELVVWGGAVRDGAQAFNDGFAFNPEASAWEPLPASPLAPRYFAGAVWTGKEVVIWGGLDDSSGVLADGAAYNPTTHAWRVLPDAPIGGLRPLVSVWTGKQMLIWGSSGPQGPTAVSGAAYDPGSNSWSLLPDPPVAPMAGQAVWTGRNLIVMGPQASRSIQPQVLQYDPTAEKWTALPTPDLIPWTGIVWDGSTILAVDDNAGAETLNLDTDQWSRAEGPPLHAGEFGGPLMAYSSGDTLVVAFGGEAVLSNGTWINLTDQLPTSHGVYTPVAAGDAIVLFTSGTSKNAPGQPAPIPIWVAQSG